MISPARVDIGRASVFPPAPGARVPTTRFPVIVRKAFRLAGRTYQPGDRLELSAAEAAAFVYRHKVAELAPPGRARKDEAPEPAGEEPRRDGRGRYRRRDLQADADV